MDDKIVLVLCPTVLHNSFRSQHFTKKKAPPTSIAAFKKWLNARFIAEIIIEISSEIPEGEKFAVTSKKIFDKFLTKYNRTPEADKYDYPLILSSFIFQVDDESINKLDEKEGIIVIADILANRGNYNPIIVTDMKDKTVGCANDYYKEYTKQVDPKIAPQIPFRILDMEEAANFLILRFPDQYNLLKQRDIKYRGL